MKKTPAVTNERPESPAASTQPVFKLFFFCFFVRLAFVARVEKWRRDRPRRRVSASRRERGRVGNDAEAVATISFYFYMRDKRL